VSPLLALGLALAGPVEVDGALHAFVSGQVDAAYPLLVEVTEAGVEVPPEAWLFRGAVERERGALAQAAATFRAGSEAHPEAKALWLELATTASWQGAWPEALEAYERARSLDPDDPVAALGRARTLWWSGRRDAGLRVVQQVLDEHPDQDEALELRQAIQKDRPRSVTLLGGLRSDGGPAVLGGIEGVARRGPWTAAGGVERASGVASDAEAGAVWASRVGLAHRFGASWTLDAGHRAWWGGDGVVHAAAVRSSHPVGVLVPHVGVLVGQLDPVAEVGLRVGRDGLWTSGTAYRSFPSTSAGTDASMTLAGALGGRRGPVTMRVDGAWANLAPGPLLQTGAQLGLRLDGTWSVGLRASMTRGWLEREDVVATCTVSF